MSQYFAQPFGVTWRKALLSAPRLVPDSILYYTSPDGPHPITIHIPSRGRHVIPLYIFIPCTPKAWKGIVKHPILIDFHGGGFVFGSCQEQAPFCSKMARELNAISISVDYRLGPASKFPAAVEDAEDVVNAILDPSNEGYKELRRKINHHLRNSARPEIEIDASRIAVSGFSSGGNLALNLGISLTAESSELVEKDWPSVFPANFLRDIPLLLFFPSLDCRQLPCERPRPEGMQAKAGFLASLKLEAGVMPTYLPRDQAAHPRASPGLADLTDGGLHERAKMLLILPELDTLAEQSEIWVEKVESEGRGRDLQVESVKGVVHGWTQFPDSWLSEEHKTLKMDMFDKVRDFVVKVWGSRNEHEN